MKPHYVSHAPFTEKVLAVSMYRKGDVFYITVSPLCRDCLAFEALELCNGKLSRRVLRGLGAGNNPRLPGVIKGMISIVLLSYQRVGWSCDS